MLSRNSLTTSSPQNWFQGRTFDANTHDDLESGGLIWVDFTTKNRGMIFKTPKMDGENNGKPY